MDRLLGLVRHPGNVALCQAVEMSITATLWGMPLHLHAEGLRGTGKTSILRSAGGLLPRIQRIRACLYNCDPRRPHCPAHRHLPAAAVAELGAEWVPMPLLEISHSAKVGTVVGSIDLTRLVNPAQPEAALLPGTLPQAHRGIVLVDEINRLAETAPELADVLLDVMGTKPGRVQIEETGLPPVQVPVQVSVWAASNPDEDPGPLEEIRRQLSDRFDFTVPTVRPVAAATVVHILSTFESTMGLTPSYGADVASASEPATPPAVAVTPEAAGERLTRCAARLGDVRVPAPLLEQVAELYSRFGLESLRAPQALVLGAKLSAALADRTAATWDDLAVVVTLALHHRLDGDTLSRAIQHVQNLAGGRGALPVGSGVVAGLQPIPAPVTSKGASALTGASAWPLARPWGAASPPNQSPWLDQGLPGHGTLGLGGSGYGAPGHGTLDHGGFGQGTVGLGTPGPAMPSQGTLRPGQRDQGLFSDGLSGAGLPGPVQAPRPGSLWQQLRAALGFPEPALEGSRGPGAGSSVYHRTLEPRWRSGGDSIGPGASVGPYGRGPGPSPLAPVDPLCQPMQAPTAMARPLRELPPDVWVKTEQELSREVEARPR